MRTFILCALLIMAAPVGALQLKTPVMKDDVERAAVDTQFQKAGWTDAEAIFRRSIAKRIAAILNQPTITPRDAAELMRLIMKMQESPHGTLPPKWKTQLKTIQPIQ